MTQPPTTTTPAITRPDLAKDLSLLRTLSPQALHSLNRTTPAPSGPSSALETLDGYTPSSSDPEQSQGLLKAYIRDMRGDVLGIDRREGDVVGSRIDQVREEGEGIKAALDEVQV